MLSDTVTEEHVADVISRATGIPLGALLQGESERLLHMEEELKQSVVGQDQAIKAIANCVRLSRAGLRAHDRPLGVFLMVGPTGVGKTHLTKRVTEFLFRDEKALTRIDMSEYGEKFSVSRCVWVGVALDRMWGGVDVDVERWRTVFVVWVGVGVLTLLYLSFPHHRHNNNTTGSSAPPQATWGMRVSKPQALFFCLRCVTNLIKTHPHPYQPKDHLTPNPL